MNDANAKALADQFERMGISKEDIRRKFTEFGQPSSQWKAGQVQS
jgi:hypothetical protein